MIVFLVLANLGQKKKRAKPGEKIMVSR